MRQTPRGRERFRDDPAGMKSRPSKLVAHIQFGFVPGGMSSPELLGVVATLTLKVAAVVPLTFTVDGTEQVAPVGAPVHFKLAVPLIPWPPIVSL